MEEAPLPSSDTPKDADHGALKQLLEKNLKWSQIIYEQNRRINKKLIWMSVSSWLRVFIILAPLILGILFFPRLWREFEERYGNWFGFKTTAQQASPQSVEEMIRVLPVTDVQKDQLRSMLK